MKTLVIKNLSAYWETTQILFDVSASFQKGTVSVIVGPNGSGKSTFLHAIVGDPSYRIQYSHEGSSGIFLDEKRISEYPIDERAHAGIFLSFQNPPPIAGVTIADILHSSVRAIHSDSGMKDFDNRMKKNITRLDMKKDLLTRSVHEGFSGGEKKKIEMLTALMVRPVFALFDEIDTGVDVDALKLLGIAMKELLRQGTGLVIVTHNLAITRLVTPEKVLVMNEGKIVKEGGKSLLTNMLKKGFSSALYGKK